MLIRSIIFILFFTLPASFLLAQNENNKLYFIITRDGNEYIGNVEAETDIDITLRLRNREITVVPRTNIKLFEPVTEDNFLRGKYVHPNRFANRYLLGTSAISPEKNQLCLSTVYGSAWNLDYGINDVYSVGLSSTIVGVPVMLNAQGNYKIGNQFYFGATATAGWLSWADPGLFFGIGGVRITSGSRNNNYTIGGGYFSLSSSLAPNGPSNVSLDDFGYINFSVMKRYTKNISGYSEAWVLKNLYLKQSIYMVNLGTKIIRHERTAWSFFLSTIVVHQPRSNKVQVIPIPCIAWSRKFGKEKN